MALQFSPLDAPQWVVSPANPVRCPDSFDYERCAALHNHLLQVGWTVSGKSLDNLDAKTWFEFHGAQAQAVRSRLSDGLISFLENALVVDEGSDHSFFYYVNGLSPPGFLWTNHELQNAGKEDRFLTLYVANDIASHPDGLVFDQEENKAIMQMSIFDSATAHNGRQQWHPLEVALTAWLDMIAVGKIQAVHEDIKSDNGNYNPWINVPWSALQLDESVTAANRLIDSIESRMQIANNSPSPARLLSEADLDAARIPPGFARSFLAGVKQPRFRYIAPGLAIPDATSVISQPFSSVEPGPPDAKVVFPILLFSSPELYNTPHDVDDIGGAELPFGHPYSAISTYPAGLYFTESDREAGDVFEDSVKLVLPFQIGGNGFARLSDGSLFGENKESETVEPRGRYDELYQPGHQPFVEMHHVRLVKVLESWIAMVERGDWTVGPEGVQGTIEDFKKADTEEDWEKFVIPMGW